ncbi:MAG: heavy-metal-associated domain-containing protein [Bacteroidales bacterium]
MRSLKVMFAILLLAGIGVNLNARDQGKTETQSGKSAVKTESIKVWGNCELCKARIEEAVKGDGVTSAAWDQKAKILAVTYDPSKTSIDALSKKIAKAGHDNEKYKADDKAYNALPSCCKYERKK